MQLRKFGTSNTNKKRKVSEDDDSDIIPAPDGWPTTESLIGTDNTLMGRKSFTVAQEVLVKFAGCPVVVGHNYAMDEDGRPNADLGDNKLAGIFVYHPQAAPLCYEQTATASATKFIRQYALHGINPFPAFMIHDRHNPTIDTANSGKMHNLEFLRFDPSNPMHVAAFNAIPDVIKETYGLKLTPVQNKIHEGESPQKIVI